MDIVKAQWNAEGDSLRLSMPLQKVDTEKRIVSGFATLDNEDLHGDVVTKEASAKAFSRFRGNIRLMHQPIPAGKLVNFREEEYYDPKTEKFYSGIYVDAYVSEGAPDVWKMVLDGTLTGFSIGGNVVDASTEFVKESGKSVRFIKDYEMVELSLVDNPANQLSNIFSIQKTADGQTVEGMIAKVNVQNVFYCKKDHEPVAIVGSDEEKACIDCGSTMKNIGWFESDGGDKAEKVNAIIEKFEASEGGENMAKKDEKETVAPKEEVVANEEEATEVDKAETLEEAQENGTIVDAPEVKDADESDDVAVTGTGEAKVEEAKELNEATKIEDGAVDENPLTRDENPLNKMFDELKGAVESAIEKGHERTTEALAEVTTKFEKELGELAQEHTKLREQFGTLTSKIEGVEKALEVVDKSSAVRKSAELGGSEEDSSLQKSNRGVWRGSIFSMDSLGG